MAASTSTIPPLVEGERLTKEEFLRRNEAYPEFERSELLEGIVYLNAAAIKSRDHGRPQSIVSAWLNAYEDATPGVMTLLPSTMELSDEDLPEPDALLIIDHPQLGRTHENDEGWLIGPAELVIEISASTTHKDLHLKKRIYQKSGVKEYIVWQTVDRKLHWFTLENSEYVSLVPDPLDQLIKSKIFPGLWLDSMALLAQDKRKVLERMQPGLSSPEHDAFIERLKQA